MQRRQAELAAAGFKLMVGCIRHNGRSDFPMDPSKRLLEVVRRSLEADAS